MKKTFLFSAFMALSMFLAANGDPVVTSVNVDTANSTVNWTGKKVTGKHEGTIAVKSGSLEMNDAGALTGGNIVIDMTSITCTDLKGGGAEKLVGHLNSDDFFGVAKYPEATLNITNVTKQEDGSYKVTADATIKGITKPISFNTTVSGSGAKAEITFDRTEYDIKYGSGSFFDNLGDKTINDDFTLMVDLKFAR